MIIAVLCNVFCDFLKEASLCLFGDSNFRFDVPTPQIATIRRNVILNMVDAQMPNTKLMMM
jgi:hypothetical protein